jgi:hypothetical protein
MPARQRGFARKRGQAWLAGWYVAGRQVTRGGFSTRTEALDYANEKASVVVERATAIRFGDPIPQAAQRRRHRLAADRRVPRPSRRRFGDDQEAPFAARARTTRLR